MDEPIMYKVINNSKPIYLPWTFNLLSREVLKKWEAYKKTSDYLGNPNDPEDQNVRKKTPEADKLRDWCNLNQIGEVSRLNEDLRTIPLSGGLRTTVADYKYCLPLGVTIVEERALADLKRYQRKEIEQIPKIGDSKPRFDYEGFLIIEPYVKGTVSIPTEKTDTFTDGNPISYKCDVCGKEFKTKLALMGHKKVHNKAV